MEIWPGIHDLEASRISNVYLLVGPPLTLVDTGPPGALPRVLEGIRVAGARPEELRRIILTHCDVDHVGNAQALQEMTGAEVCAHEDDAAVLARARPVPGPRLRHIIIGTWGRRVTPPRVDRTLRDGDTLDGLAVLHLPGHTPGHIGLQRDTVLCAGDLVAGGRKLRPSPGILTWDKESLRRSIARVGSLDVDLLLPGHGTPVNDGARRCAELANSVR